jgi:hypothetical protein
LLLSTPGNLPMLAGRFCWLRALRHRKTGWEIAQFGF